MRRHAERRSSPKTEAVDPELLRMFEDRVNFQIPSDQVIERFERYIAAHPESPFNPELYFRIAELYSLQFQRTDLGEVSNSQKRDEYFEKAREAYGGKYSPLNYNAWASLANAPNATIEQRKAFYDWWLSLADATVEDIYPYREVEQTFNGRPVDMDLETQEVVLANLQRYHAQSQRVAEDNIIWRVKSRPEELANLAGSYPETRFGQEAARLLHEFQFRGALEEFDRSMTTIAEMDGIPEEVESLGAPAATPPEPSRSASRPMGARAAPLKWFLGASALVVLVLAIVVYTLPVRLFRRLFSSMKVK